MHPALEQLILGSRDPDTKVGAIILLRGRVVGRGVNNFVHKWAETPERWQRPAKYRWVMHAEQKAIHDAYRNLALPARGLVMHTNYFPCSTCANHIVEAGIQRIVAPLPDITHHRWGPEWAATIEIFQEYGVGYQSPGAAVAVPSAAAGS